MTTKPQFTSSVEYLLDQLEQFLTNNPDISPECLGWWATRDTSLVKRLRDGGDVMTRKMDRIIAWLANPRPTSLPQK